MPQGNPAVAEDVAQFMRRVAAIDISTLHALRTRALAGSCPRGAGGCDSHRAMRLRRAVAAVSVCALAIEQAGDVVLRRCQACSRMPRRTPAEQVFDHRQHRPDSGHTPAPCPRAAALPPCALPRCAQRHHCPPAALNLHSPSTVGAAVKSNEAYLPRPAPRQWPDSAARQKKAFRFRKRHTLC
tara:strand:+ start:179 stop:730 length:552 start_codon:yes stop_codon:yes gene_type:complete